MNNQLRLKFPLIVFDGLDIFIFNSTKELETGLEGIDVQEHCFKAYDADGRALSLKAVGAWRRWFIINSGQVEIKAAEDEPNHKDELVGYLREYLKAIGQPADELHLSNLIHTCEKAHHKHA